ncbi:SAM-dependent methyltransferase [Streptomyces cocklensis]|uniref:S-adenosyl-L-methionine-dependent methyltransferase n=1 Tax=Actinacidiphila cocklensis TaxID=887465 RepID=A0A9W4DWI9_9ACTN|nr:SAM-dependent methyltransferase [Actinacidiphila cocklensis]MDD1058805.1 SAM-dependent methyltransferase [Actinacidiphila cocklensis]CAG6398925.1 S-adenosyl-L-methionine-dependent methyltransferase [Actinacidiphila cocklensis]
MTDAVNLDAVGRTALVTAAMRAAETDRPDAIHQDPYAAALAGELGEKLLAELLAAVSAAAVPGVPSGGQPPGTHDAATAGSGRRAVNAVRTRYFDEYLRAAVQEPDLRQVVVAGAGMDSRAYRMDWPGAVRFFEVDRPAVLDYKRECLAAETPRADHRFVPMDLASPSWPDALVDAGYEPDRPSAWLLEGLLFYLPESGVHQVLDQVAELAAPGSRIAADLVNAAALTMPSQRPLLDVFAGWGCPWLFGCDEPAELFARHGFDAGVAQPGEPGADFGRWPDPVPPRDLADVYRVFLVTGRRR